MHLRIIKIWHFVINVMVKSSDTRARLLGFESQLCHVQALGSWASHSLSLCFRFHDGITGIDQLPGGVVRIEYMCKAFQIVPGTQ